MLTYSVSAIRRDGRESIATCKQATFTMDTDTVGRSDAFNPAELLLAAVAACMLKNLERIAPLLSFHFIGAEVLLQGARQDRPPKMVRIEYEIVLDTDESDRRLTLMHDNIRKYGTISNTVAEAVEMAGVLVRRAAG
jgi:uncharacterized OsmC-like protein